MVRHDLEVLTATAHPAPEVQMGMVHRYSKEVRRLALMAAVHHGLAVRVGMVHHGLVVLMGMVRRDLVVPMVTVLHGLEVPMAMVHHVQWATVHQASKEADHHVRAGPTETVRHVRWGLDQQDHRRVVRPCRQVQDLHSQHQMMVVQTKCLLKTLGRLIIHLKDQVQWPLNLKGLPKVMLP
jgi:hypothetical protein